MLSMLKIIQPASAPVLDLLLFACRDVGPLAADHLDQVLHVVVVKNMATPKWAPIGKWKYGPKPAVHMLVV